MDEADGVQVAFTFQPVDEVAARAITGWRYPEPYAFYNLSATASSLEHAAVVRELLDPALRYYAVWCAREGALLAGFCCFGPAARVGISRQPAVYAGSDLLDIGLGLRPDLTGRGLGGAFLRSVLVFGTEQFAPGGFRLTVATFNQRAIRVYERAGFAPDHRVLLESSRGPREFLVMTRPPLSSAESNVPPGPDDGA